MIGSFHQQPSMLVGVAVRSSPCRAATLSDVLIAVQHLSVKPIDEFADYALRGI
jgi:hypothetical protein